ncbi:GNAT family N-acetyltransferase [Streptomyces nitrosporeus]|uniref:GNAT family N-acetyltransferase n=1 Tax=Streptomyces nitrosporeus TaxID=28894 RepID=A0A5J6FJ96_9ACTN|nr:GNAT family N-acetyltransferase [Streptomyces nitrosporeus]QEU76061.1 GNAT family N-acetyltransferase [Streptomyces nitrosporeus]GGZ07549.1 N-acetyltransferase [Streptomyces nitrosporeus]
MRASITSRRSAAGRGIRVRRAVAGDAGRLTRLVTTSRAYEGPYAPMVAGYRVGPDYIEAHRVFTAVDADDRVLGFYALLLDFAELDLMFVADAAQGLGIGRLLAGHLREEAGRAGLRRVRIVAHPPAEGFYLEMGAERTGTVRAAPPAVMWDRPELAFTIGSP